MNDKLSIYIPIYNDARYIRETVLSCVNEARTIFLYDNASTDRSGDICAELSAEFTNVIHIRRETNIGAFENMRDAISTCETPYVCFLGSHDKLTPGYGDTLVQALEASPDVLLACGTIQHIDEDGRNLPEVTRAHWINSTQDIPANERVDAFVGKLRDCFLFYGVHRTDSFKPLWNSSAMLGFDRVMLVRIAAKGKIAYIPEATFLARDFPKTRDSKKDRERRSETLASTQVAKSNFERNHEIAKTVLALAHDDHSLSLAFSTLDKLNRRLHSRRRFQRQRLAFIAAGAILASLILFLIYRCGQ